MAHRGLPHREFFEEEAGGERIAQAPLRKICQAIVWLARNQAHLQHQIDELRGAVRLVGVTATFTEGFHMGESFSFDVQLTGNLSDGTSRPLTDADGVSVSASQGTYIAVDASSGIIESVSKGATGTLSFTGPNGEALGTSGTYTGGSGQGGGDATLTGVSAVITPA